MRMGHLVCTIQGFSPPLPFPCHPFHLIPPSHPYFSTSRLSKEHLPGVLDHLLDADEESNGFTAIEDAVVVGQGEVHHGADLDLAVDGDWLVLDGVQAEDSGLGQVDDGRAHEGAEDAAVRDGEGAAGHVLDGELVVAGLETMLVELLLHKEDN